MNVHRPLSPHLQVYRLPLTGLISITHRLTGILLSVALVLLVYVLWIITQGQDAYVALQTTLQLWWIKVVGIGMLYALCLHLCHGIRHVLWDRGHSFAKQTLWRYACYELAASVLLTGLTLMALNQDWL